MITNNSPSYCTQLTKQEHRNGETWKVCKKKVEEICVCIHPYTCMCAQMTADWMSIGITDTGKIVQLGQNYKIYNVHKQG